MRRRSSSRLPAEIGQAAGDPGQALLLARGEFAQLVGRYALASAFEEVFRLMAWLFIAALILVPFCRPAPQGAPPPADAH